MLLSLVVYILLSEIIFSFAEHQTHQNFMHKKVLSEWFYKKYPNVFKEVYEGHAIRHHGIWYRQFDFEPHPEGSDDNIRFRAVEIITALVLFLPIDLLFWMISPLAGVTFVVMLLIHAFTWNTIHTQMHQPSDTFFADWGVFRWLATHHYLHHQFTNKNYNIVFPLADYILGTKIKPRMRDLRELLRLGYLKPRTARTELRLKKWRNQVALQRQTVLIQDFEPAFK
ncbi:sterol desaturase family protein [Nostoc sp. CMAA1605]|uniref:sterol desaturase family protein n=1 Tax=Nostoc sp. CMAA1605 TaxID=2055159 RepID=UPI001F37E6C2|nr:sterol desaturase family protein [Nostoc sp. CMAA1605]MCF4969119.1 hypothetical protein [Nostoc sp. CMAA1605]